MNGRTLLGVASAALLATQALAQPTNVNLTCTGCSGAGTSASPYQLSTNTFNCGRTVSWRGTATGAGSKVWTLTSSGPAGYTTTPSGAQTVTNSLTSATFSRTHNRAGAATCQAGATNANMWSVTVAVRFSGQTASNSKQVFFRSRDATFANLGGRFCACDNATCISNPAVATDNCDPNPTETFLPPERRTNLNCAGNYNLARDHTVADCNGNSILRTLNITVRDFVAPVVTQNLSEVACMWPPDHEMVFFSNSSFPIVATDNCSGIASRGLAGAVSDQPDELPGEGPNPLCSGDGNTGPDSESVSGGLNLRAERCGDSTHPDDGRTYSVQGYATDGCGNRSANRTVGTVSVPHDSDDQTLTECVH